MRRLNRSFWKDVIIENQEKGKLPDGTYTVSVENAELKTPDDKNHYIQLILKIIDDPKYTGRYIYERMYWHNEGCKKMMAAKLTWLGFKPDDFNSLPEPTNDAFISSLFFVFNDAKYTAVITTKGEFQQVRKLTRLIGSF